MSSEEELSSVLESDEEEVLSSGAEEESDVGVSDDDEAGSEEDGSDASALSSADEDFSGIFSDADVGSDDALATPQLAVGSEARKENQYATDEAPINYYQQALAFKRDGFLPESLAQMNACIAAVFCARAGVLKMQGRLTEVRCVRRRLRDRLPLLLTAAPARRPPRTQAIRDVNYAIELVPANSVSYIQRAELFKLQGRLPEAIGDYET